MSRPVCEQRRLKHRGREFHFVSYDGQPANPKQSQPATDPAWWLMSGGRRWEVMPYHAEQDAGELDLAFIAWLDTHVFPVLDKRDG